MRIVSLLLLLGLTIDPAQRLSAQATGDRIPNGPFKTVHLMSVDPIERSKLLSALADLNQALHHDGCGTCEYHLYSLFAGTTSMPNYMLTGDWPGRAEYIKTHSSAAYADANRRNPLLARLYSAEHYGRFIEVH